MLARLQVPRALVWPQSPEPPPHRVPAAAWAGLVRPALAPESHLTAHWLGLRWVWGPLLSLSPGEGAGRGSRPEQSLAEADIKSRPGMPCRWPPSRGQQWVSPQDPGSAPAGPSQPGGQAGSSGPGGVLWGAAQSVSPASIYTALGRTVGNGMSRGCAMVTPRGLLSHDSPPGAWPSCP